MAKEYKLSPERFEKLKEELNYLKTVREKEVADQIKEARSFGDLSENSEYDEAKNEQGKLYSRIAEVEEILQNCVVIEDEHSDDTTIVRLGSRIKVLDKDKNEIEIRELDDDIYAAESEFKDELVPQATPEALAAEEAAAEDFDFDDLELDDDLSLDDDF